MPIYRIMRVVSIFFWCFLLGNRLLFKHVQVPAPASPATRPKSPTAQPLRLHHNHQGDQGNWEAHRDLQVGDKSCSWFFDLKYQLVLAFVHININWTFLRGGLGHWRWVTSSTRSVSSSKHKFSHANWASYLAYRSSHSSRAAWRPIWPQGSMVANKIIFPHNYTYIVYNIYNKCN